MSINCTCAPLAKRWPPDVPIGTPLSRETPSGQFQLKECRMSVFAKGCEQFEHNIDDQDRKYISISLKSLDF